MTGSSEASAAELAEFVALFDEACSSALRSVSPADAPSYVLNGQARAEIRRLVPLGERRRLGAFFTPRELADDVASSLHSVQGQVTVIDPCSGAGDLLLAAARALEEPVRSGTARANFVGVDLVDEFSQVARMRFELLSGLCGLDMSFRFITGDGLSTPDVSADTTTHVLLNPPFAVVPSHKGCEWARGKVSGAADFFARVIVRFQPGVEISAILPDVLRSGSRYRRWRDFVAKRLDLDTPEPKGRFDSWTDVDVFVLRGRTRQTETDPPEIEWVPSNAGPTVAERFDVSVGPLVDYRSLLDGPVVPYLVAKDFPTWGTISRVQRTRRFSGRLHESPFVAIPRTSRPGEPYRARAAVVTDPRGIAVENHLLVLSPRRGGVDECRRLMCRLQSEEVNDWLDRVIRCRHLTVGAVGSIPWTHGEGFIV